MMWDCTSEIDRTRLVLMPQPIDLDGATTDERGTATFGQDVPMDAGQNVLTISYAGAAGHWPADLEQQLQVR
jgi:hypothetical protein